MRVGDVMHHLAHRPPAIAVRRIELFVCEICDRGAEGWRARSDSGDLGSALIGREHSSHDVWT
jgi:hypothetical protein